MTKGIEVSNLQRRSVDYDLHAAAPNDRGLARVLSYSSKSLPHRFIEEVTYGVLPFAMLNSRGSVSVSVEPDNDAVIEAVCSALGRDRNLPNSVYDFLRGCIASVLLFGNDAYEIVYGPSVNTQKQRRFQFVRIPPLSLSYRGDRMPIQLIPERVAAALGVPRRVEIPRSHLMIFEPPPNVRADLPLILERLAVLSEPIMPEFAFDSLRPGRYKVPFELSAYSSVRKLALAESSRAVGWMPSSASDLADQNVVEHYWWQRQFAFERFKAELRYQLLSTLNDALARAGKISGISAQIQFLGFPSINDIDQALEHLLSGDRSLTEIDEVFRCLR